MKIINLNLIVQICFQHHITGILSIVQKNVMNYYYVGILTSLQPTELTVLLIIMTNKTG
ncbi:hypothetical protein ACQ27_gp088 [Klebsiella phage K64-1]|uniref:hypothetical protein n=1 Tax=Klebsiella phage K64-1 TaxID=1439894 RepID=UPI00248B60BD|nr:hypothetical protein ACQ27_gp088 [Klebsiella phage K64-1]